jgi:ABC-type spermidine/putrescine transport system permease subunit II
MQAFVPSTVHASCAHRRVQGRMRVSGLPGAPETLLQIITVLSLLLLMMALRKAVLLTRTRVMAHCEHVVQYTIVYMQLYFARA